MAKPMDQFGGWLRFFQVVVFLNVIVVYVSVGLMIYLYSASPDVEAMSLLQLIVLVVFSIPYGLVMVRILLLITRKGRGIPVALAKAAWTAIGILLLLAVAEAFALMLDNPSLGFLEAATWPRAVLWLVLFSTYLQTSKRVRLFYGANVRTVFPVNPSADRASELHDRLERDG